MNLPLAPHAIVEINQQIYDTWKEGSPLASVRVELTTDKTSEATVVVWDENFLITDSHLGDTGLNKSTVNVWLGYGRDLGAPLFQGKFAGHDHDGKLATFRFHDLSIDMKREKKARYHNRKTDFAVLRQLAADNGLAFSVSKDAIDSEPHASLIQRGLTDWEFARTIARRAGLRLYVIGQTLYAEEAGKSKQERQTITYRDDFLLVRPISLTYKLPENRRGRPGKVEVRGRGHGGSQLSGCAGEGTRGNSDLGVHEDLPHHTQRGAERRAQAKRATHRESAFEHRIRLLPAYEGSRIGLRESIGLAGVGDFYGGTYIVHELCSEFRAGSLIDELTLRRDIERPRTKK